MADQLADHVKRMQAEGVPEADILAFVDQFDSEGMKPAASHQDAEARPIATGGGRGTGLDVRKSNKWASDNAPVIGATLATLPMGGGGGLIPLALRAAAAGVGGAAGSGMRGDNASTMAFEGGKQALMQGGGEAVVNGGRMIAHGLMRGTVPKNIAKEFDQVDIAGEMLDRGVVPGSKQSAGRVSRLSGEANARTSDVARQMGPLSRRDITAGFREPFEEASTAKMSDTATKIAEHTRAVGRDLKGGISAEGALARKRVLQRQGEAALNNPETGAFMPQLKNTERATITGLLRRDPKMAAALNESQALMAVDDVMKDAAHSNMVTRGRIGGLPAMAMSPMGMGATAHGVNQGRKIADPRILRLMDLIMGSQQE